MPHSSSSSLKAGSFQHQVFSKQGKKKSSSLEVAEYLEAILGHLPHVHILWTSPCPQNASSKLKWKPDSAILVNKY